jgi:hypothetical protein
MSRSLRRALIAALFFGAFLAQAGAWSAEPDLAAQWEARLADMALTLESRRIGGEGGRSSVTAVWHLCRGGGFRHTRSATVSAEAPGSQSSSMSQVSQTGRWSVAFMDGRAILVLRYKDGTQVSHALAAEGDTISLDGEPVSRAPSRDCP